MGSVFGCERNEHKNEQKKNSEKGYDQEEILAFAFGEMGLTPHEYYCMSPVEFYLAAKGFHKAKAREWEHTRMIAYTTASTVPSKKKMPPIQKWLPLPTDNVKDISNERVKQMLEKAKKKVNGSK